MRVVSKEEDLKSMLEEAQGEAERAFGNPAVFLERYVGKAKHLEVQILGDRNGNVVHLHERIVRFRDDIKRWWRSPRQLAFLKRLLIVYAMQALSWRRV